MTELFQRIPEEKQRRIMQAAVEEFADNGYDYANTNRIAKAAGISVGSLFQYCTSKEDLFLSTVKHGALQMRQELDGLSMQGGDIFEKVEKVLRMVQKHTRKNLNLIRLYNQMTAQGRPKLVLKEVEWIESFTATLYAQLLEKAKMEGAVRSDCDARMFAFLIDNLFMMLQFSYGCDYFQQRFRVYVSSDILDRDEFVVQQTLKFIRGACEPRGHEEVHVGEELK